MTRCKNCAYAVPTRDEQNARLYDYECWSQERVWMSPQAFLRASWRASDGPYPGPDGLRRYHTFDEKHIGPLRERIRKGQPMDPLFLEFVEDDDTVRKHEGRHRALAAIELGIDRVPVIIFHKKFGAVSKLTGLPVTYFDTPSKRFGPQLGAIESAGGFGPPCREEDRYEEE